MASTDALRTEPAATDVVEIHTDGGCSGNPGPGGWGAVLRWRDHERELSGQLSDHFDTRVRVNIGRSKGKITIEFATGEDLDRIVAILDGRTI